MMREKIGIGIGICFSRGEGLHHQRPSKPCRCLFHITPVIPNRHFIPSSLIKNNKKILYDPSLEVFHHYTKEGNTWKGIG